MRTYAERLSTGKGIFGFDSIIRDIAIIDDEYFALEQFLTISVVRIGNSWIALIGSDIGRPFSIGNNGPFSTSDTSVSYLDTCFYSELDQAKADDHIGQNASPSGLWTRLTCSNYGERLDSSLMKRSPSYALSELFALAASSERQFLNLLEHNVAETIRRLDVPGNDNIQAVKTLNYFSNMIRRHKDSIDKTITALELKSDSLQLGALELLGFPMQQKLKSMNDSLTQQFVGIDEQFSRISSECDWALGLLMTRSMLAESERAMKQLEYLRKLTLMTVVFLPLSFITSFLGMNLTSIQIHTQRYWSIALIMLMFGMSWSILGSERFPLEKSFKKRWQREVCTWSCECGKSINVHMNAIKSEDTEAVRRVPGNDKRSKRKKGAENNSGGAGSRSCQTGSISPSYQINTSRGAAHNLSGKIQSRPSSNSVASPPDINYKPPQYLELCVNVGFMQRQLTEIELTLMQSDGALFRKIAERYKAVRKRLGPRKWITRPTKLRYIKLCSCPHSFS
ncbi:hypothetical protein EJ08DRAFT_482462 [Tothia fuscella]|uniref:Uncharacterized protein n=1 Tax=Tothia fuscella TaxID=1048955 RepID=A0A9P4NHW1_9PEZI|nr:hypothetical protein EJ08DRAFT_482462 [Tothia fuscella]